MSGSTSSEPSGPKPFKHDCPPDCPTMAWVIQHYKRLLAEDDPEFAIEGLAYAFAHCIDDMKKACDLGKLDPEIFLHILIIIKRHFEFEDEKLPELNETAVTGGPPLENKHIRKILVKIGFPSDCESKGLTNDEAASMLLENMERIEALAWKRSLDLSELRRIRCFAIQNIEQLTSQKNKKKGKKKK